MNRATCLTLVMIATLAAATICTIAPREAIAQGCAMCYQSAAASGARAIDALRQGIAVLMIPPVLICAGIARLAYRRRHLQEQAATNRD